MPAGQESRAFRGQSLAFLESIFIDQATLNGTRPNSPSGVNLKPARPLVGRYFLPVAQFREWVRLRVPRICSLLGWVVGPQSHQ